MRNRRGSNHMIEIRTIAIPFLTVHDEFLAIVYFLAMSRDLSEILEHVQNKDSLQFPLIFRIVTNRIAEGLTLHDVVKTSASWGGGAIAVRPKLKIVKCALFSNDTTINSGQQAE